VPSIQHCLFISGVCRFLKEEISEAARDFKAALDLVQDKEELASKLKQEIAKCDKKL